jgi:RNA polymerase sigma-70 factor (ECF subfamily)
MTACRLNADNQRLRELWDGELEHDMDGDPVDLMVQEMPRLRRYAHYLTRNAADADHLSQESLATAIAKVDRWRPGTNMRAWLFTIQRNLFITGLRRARRAPMVYDINAMNDGPGTPPRQEHRLFLQEVKNGIGKLSIEHRQVIDLVVARGLSYEQAAAKVSVPIGTIRSRLSRARDTLKFAFSDDHLGQAV